MTDPLPSAPARRPSRCEELGQLHRPLRHRRGRVLVRRAGEELGVAVAHHRRARPGRHHHGVVPGEGPEACRATRRASSGWPDVHPGWPQHVWRRGTATSTPARSSTVRAAFHTEGAATSARHVRMSRALIAGSYPPRCYPEQERKHGPDPVSTERYHISKRAADPVDRVKNRETMELRRTLPSSLSLPKQQ